MKDVANAVGSDWAVQFDDLLHIGQRAYNFWHEPLFIFYFKAMTPEEKVPYEEEARKSKEEGKQDLTNKYTSAGERYNFLNSDNNNI